jgi:hypothetical protein
VSRSALFLLATLAACGRLPPSQSKAPASPAARSEDEWSKTSWEDRHDTMTWLVLPSMARLFWRFEGKPYPDLTCFSCHGEDAETVAYRMPHALPPLDPAHMPRRDSPDPGEAKIAAFMEDEVTPELTEMLGKADVSCFTCHRTESQ